MIAIGQELKVWAITVSGYGTLLEYTESKVAEQVEHYRGRGREVVVTEMAPVATPVPKKPKLLQWNELKPGDYWAYPFEAADVAYDEHEGSTFVMVSEFDGRLQIDGESESGDLDESWGHYQFLPINRPTRHEVEFQAEDLSPEQDDDEDEE